MKLRRTMLAVLAVATIPAVSYAAGLWSTLPIVGQSSFCAAVVGASNVQGGITGQGTGTGLTGGVICAQTVPAGPTALTGNEGVPADLNIGSTSAGAAYGGPTQTVLIPTGTLAAFVQDPSAPRNFVRNGDISVNPFQRGTAENSQPWGAIKATAYSADGFSMQAGSGNTDILWSKQTGSADVLAGQFTASLRMRRDAASTDNAQLCMHTVQTSQNSQALVGQKVIFSFWARTGAGFSPSLSAFTASIIAGSGTDQSPTSMQAGTWTNQNTPATSTLTGSTTWTQYSVSGTVPFFATGTTQNNQVGEEICYTPSVGPSATDFIEVSNVQLEIATGNNTTPSPFEHHSAQQDLAIAQAYFWQLNEAAAGTPDGTCFGTATFICNVVLPVQMRQATLGPVNGGAAIAAAAVTPLTAGSFKIGGGAGAASTITSPTATASSTNLMAFTITNTNGGISAGSAMPLQSGGGVGKLGISAEL